MRECVSIGKALSLQRTISILSEIATLKTGSPRRQQGTPIIILPWLTMQTITRYAWLSELPLLCIVVTIPRGQSPWPLTLAGAPRLVNLVWRTFIRDPPPQTLMMEPCLWRTPPCLDIPNGGVLRVALHSSGTWHQSAAFIGSDTCLGRFGGRAADAGSVTGH